MLRFFGQGIHLFRKLVGLWALVSVGWEVEADEDDSRNSGRKGINSSGLEVLSANSTQASHSAWSL
jgi:hypothetical protein